MVEAYNFLASWQLFPEKSEYEQGMAAKSGFLRIEGAGGGKALRFSEQYVAQDGQGSFTEYILVANGEKQPIGSPEAMAEASFTVVNASHLHLMFYHLQSPVPHLHVHFEIMPNGYLKRTQKHSTDTETPAANTDYFHKQMSVLPYASSAGSVVVRPTEEGAIKHTALRAMEEQTNMQLDQIREQIELLARQAQNLRKRRELSMLIYEARLGFQPVIGQTYYLYEKRDGTHTLSLVSPLEWGGTMPYNQFLSAVKLMADHTWTEISDQRVHTSPTTIVV